VPVTVGGRLGDLAAAARVRLSILLGLVRFGGGLRGFLKHAVTPPEARAVIRARLAGRDTAFLDLVRRAVFGYARSPYRLLFQASGCEMGDLASLVQRDGIESALARLRDAGVYVGFEEFKGRQPAVRGSQVFHFREHDFDNPLHQAWFAFRSGGSRGAPSRVLIDLDYLADRVPLWCLWFEEHRLLGAPLVFLRPYHPGAVNEHLICARFGQRFTRWFATARAGSLAYRAVSDYLNTLVRHVGRLPEAEFTRPEDLAAVGRYLQQLAGAGRGPCLRTEPSAVIRLAQALGGDAPLRGVTCLLGFEPLTEARRAAIESAGAAAVMTYGFSEGGTVGQQCRYPTEPDDVHLADDAFAVIPGDASPAGDPACPPLLLSSLRPWAPKILLNTDIGDTGVLETRACGCLFEEIGYRRHLHTIRSSHKLTGEGVTFLGSDLAQVLEAVLPRRFGGAPTDYQLVAEADEAGVARYRLLVSPSVGALDERTVVETFLGALARQRSPYPFMVEQWRRGGVLTVVRQRPQRTPGGKLLPVRSLRA
jgi:hypothetical protein